LHNDPNTADNLYYQFCIGHSSPETGQPVENVIAALADYLLQKVPQKYDLRHCSQVKVFYR
jgi:hypothetical protein